MEQAAWLRCRGLGQGMASRSRAIKGLQVQLLSQGASVPGLLDLQLAAMVLQLDPRSAGSHEHRLQSEGQLHAGPGTHWCQWAAAA